MSNYLDTALKYFRPGKIHLIPVNSDKTPACKWKGFQETQTKDDIRRIFSRDSWGIAMLTGVGGLEVIDFDSDDWNEGGVLHQLVLESIDLDLKLASTPSGGMHAMYRSSSRVGNQKLAFNKEKQVVIETRGRGGYVVIAPTFGYKWFTSGPIPTISFEDRASLLLLCKSFNRYEEPAQVPIQSRTPAQLPSNHTSTMEAFNQSHDYMSIQTMLEEEGWKYVREGRDRIYMRRPNKDKGHSGDIHKGKCIFKAWSTNALPFEAERAYDAFGVYAVLNHMGDYKVAARSLYQQGYGDRTNVSVKIEEGKVIADLATAIEVTDYVDDSEYTMHYITPGGEEIPIAGPGSIIVITGDTGAGKSTIQDLMCMTAMNEQPFFGLRIKTGGRKIIRFDTEQEMFWLAKSKKRILKTCNYDVDQKRLKYYSIENIQKTADKNEYVRKYATEEGDIGMLFIDNIVDLLGKVNDEEGSLEFVNHWKHLAKEHQFILVVTLHETRSSGMAQGWMGKILEQRSAWTIRMVKKKNESGEYFVAENRKKRGKFFEPIRFQRGRHGEINEFRVESKFEGI